MNRIKELVREANFSSRAFPTGTEYASWETDEVFIYNYLTGKLRKVYFTKGSKDQCCLQNIQSLVFNTLYNNDKMIASSLPKIKKKCFIVLKCTMYIAHTVLYSTALYRLYGIYTVCFNILMIPFNCTFISFFAKPFNKLIKY